ncbi:MAG: radical SAM protein [Endomicrobiaceae bacterium]|nr:radical SAM protein [Endomicrobiaceae bacterium]
MEHLNQILEVCKKIKGFHNMVNKTQSDPNIDNYEVYAYKIIVELIQKLNNSGRTDEVKQLYLDIDKYVPEKNKKLKNALLNEYEIAQGITFLKSFPRHIQLVTTLQCNLNCIMCGDKKENVFISDKYLNDLIEIMPYLQFLTLRGGEVFYDKRIGRIIDESYKNGVKLSIVTNALLLDDVLINKLMYSDVALVCSVDSPFKETYESIRVGAKFDTLIENLKKIRSARKSKNFLVINMVVMRRNYNEIEDMLYFAKEYGFDLVTLCPIEGNTESSDENIFENNLDNSLVQKIADRREYFEKIANKLGIKLDNNLPCNVKYCGAKNINNISEENIEGGIDKKQETIILNNKQNEFISQEKNDNKLFCYAPFRQMFQPIDIYSCKPLCRCPVGNDEQNKNIVFEKQENIVLSSWNSNDMVFYRKNILMHKYERCSNVCLNAAQDTFEGKRILLWEVR